MLPYHFTPAGDNGPGRNDRARQPPPKKDSVVAAGHEADILAFGAVGRDQTSGPGHRPNLGLGQIAQREKEAGELVLAQTVQYVGLVLGPVQAAPEKAPVSGRAVRASGWTLTQRPGVVARGDVVTVVGRGPVQESAELDRLVADNARVGRSPGQIGLNEGLDDQILELLAEVEDIMRKPQASGDPGGVLGRVGGLAAGGGPTPGDGGFSRTGGRGHHGRQPHRDPDDREAGLDQEGRGDRTVHAPAHGHQDAIHAGRHPRSQLTPPYWTHSPRRVNRFPAPVRAAASRF